MEDGPKKISFAFSKMSKKTSIISSKISTNKKPEENDKEFIEGFESNSIKLKDPIKTEDKILVIPLKKPSVAAVENLPSQNLSQSDDSNNLPSNIIVGGLNENVINNANDDVQNSTIQQKPLTLDELAAKEILDDLNEEKTKSEAKVISVPLANTTSTGEKESTLDDYENVPVGEFGVAMLRGMGWAPGKGIGKNEKVIAPSLPPVRPKGMGLGADKVIEMPDSEKSKADTDGDLKMVVGSFIKVIAGQNKDSYGKIEAFDEESGRIIVKLAVNNLTVSLNEFMFKLVNKKEYHEKSKIVNLSKYENYKKSEEIKESLKSIQSKRKSRSKSPEESITSKSNYSSQSVSSSRDSHSSSVRNEKTKADRKESNYHRGRSSSSDKSSSTSSDYSRKKHRIKKKKPSSHRLKSRSRSRSPRKHKKHKRR